MQHSDIAVIGDGYCSLALVAGLVRESKKPLNIVVIGESGEWGPGVAYGRCDAGHLLNVPANQMGALDDAGAFFTWAKTGDAGAFLPRRLYGEYLKAEAQEAMRLAAQKNHRIEIIRARAGGVEVKDNRVVVSLPGGEVRCERLVLATGVPEAFRAEDDPGDFLIDPWRTDFTAFCDSTRSVAIIGTGLTMIDVVSSLEANGFRGRIAAFSRRGLMPKPHSDLKAEMPEEFFKLEGTLAQKMKALRANAKELEKNNAPWQSYFDFLRPHTADIWRSLSAVERKKFLRRLFTYWNIHRHRQPQESEAMLRKLEAEGRFAIHRAPVRWATENGRLSADFAGGSLTDIQKVFNCRGPDYSLRGDDFLSDLIKQKLIQRHETGIGLAVNEDYSAIGAAAGKIFVTGSMLTGEYLEATSVPELRKHCARLAAILVH